MRRSAATARSPRLPRTAASSATGEALEIHPATPDRWQDLVDLFQRPGPRGGKTVTQGCWCMFWRRAGGDFDYGWGRGDGSGNRAQMRALVADGREPGLIGYLDGAPVAWVSVAPRDDFARLECSRTLGRVDDKPVWSIVCFYVHGRYKRHGFGGQLLDAAVEYARDHGATLVEGYPAKPGNADPFTGFDAMFQDARFEMVREGSGTGRSVMRRRIRQRVRRPRAGC